MTWGLRGENSHGGGRWEDVGPGEGRRRDPACRKASTESGAKGRAAGGPGSPEAGGGAALPSRGDLGFSRPQQKQMGQGRGSPETSGRDDTPGSLVPRRTREPGPDLAATPLQKAVPPPAIRVLRRRQRPWKAGVAGGHAEVARLLERCHFPGARTDLTRAPLSHCQCSRTRPPRRRLLLI